MCISQKGKSKVHKIIKTDGKDVEKVRPFKYLGTWITDNEYSVKDIRARIAMGKAIFMEKKTVDRKIGL